jgi:hypothetical protein
MECEFLACASLQVHNRSAFDVLQQSVIGRDEVVQYCIKYEHEAIAMAAASTYCVLLCACSSCIAIKGVATAWCAV